MQVRTIAGLIPLLPAVGLPRPQAAHVDRLGKGFARRARELGPAGRHPGRPGARARRAARRVLVSVLHPDDVRQALREFLDEDAFLSPHGLRSVSKRYEGHPYSIPGMPGATIDYEPAESTTAMFGGNSNWRGPVWMPLNYLAVRQFVRVAAVPRRRLHARVPDRLGRSSTPSARSPRTSPTAWCRSGCPDADGRRPVFGGGRAGSRTDPAWKDNLLFFEYFHGDDGAGLGAMHQTGWTALVVDLILDPPGTPRTG